MSTSQASFPREEKKVEAREVGAQESFRSQEQEDEANEIRKLFNYTTTPCASRYDDTPNEIRYYASRYDQWVQPEPDGWISSESNDISLGHDWLDSIKRALTGFGQNYLLARGQPTIYSGDEHVNHEEFIPDIASIGPNHSTDPYSGKLQCMRDYKLCCLHRLIARHDGSNDTMALLDACFADMKTLGRRVRSCYSQEIKMESNELASVMMLDGCFILHLLLKQDDNIKDFEELEYSLVRSKLWIWQMVKYDLLILSNQIPLFIIEKLFDRLRTPADANVNLVHQALKLLRNLLPQRIDEGDPCSIPSHQVHHLLHLFYLSIVPHELTIEQPTPSSFKANWIPCVRELQDAGVEFKKKRSALSFLDVKFSNGVMEIPPLEIHDYSMKLFKNLIAFEQCYPDTRCHITSYAAFMDCVINTPNDVRLLHLKGILTDRTGTDQGAVTFFRRLCKGIHYASDKNYLSSVFRDVTKYQESRWHKWRAGLVRDYFNNPWTSVSVAAAVVLLLLAFIQTFFTIYPYFKPKN